MIRIFLTLILVSCIGCNHARDQAILNAKEAQWNSTESHTALHRKTVQLALDNSKKFHDMWQHDLDLQFNSWVKDNSTNGQIEVVHFMTQFAKYQEQVNAINNSRIVDVTLANKTFAAIDNYEKVQKMDFLTIQEALMASQTAERDLQESLKLLGTNAASVISTLIFSGGL